MKIAVIGRSAYAILLKKYIRKGFVVKHFNSLHDESLKNFKNVEVLISMTWGKSIWGENTTQKIPDLKQLKLIHLPGSGTDGINFRHRLTISSAPIERSSPGTSSNATSPKCGPPKLAVRFPGPRAVFVRIG